MQARELVEIAGIVSAHGPLLVECQRPISMAALEEYWSASKCRLDRWGRDLKRFETESVVGYPHRSSGSAAAVIEEVISGEALSRVWAAVLSAHDRQHAMEDAEIVSRSVLLAHLESRNRALKLLLDPSVLDHHQAVRLNRLRRTSERWSDLLLGFLVGVPDTAEFAVEADRASEFSSDFRFHHSTASRTAAWALLRLSLREAFRLNLREDSPNADLHSRIAASVMSCFPPELFDSTGLMRSLWLSRLAHGTRDAQGMIEDLFAAESTVETSQSPFIRSSSMSAKRFDRGHEF